MQDFVPKIHISDEDFAIITNNGALLDENQQVFSIFVDSFQVQLISLFHIFISFHFFQIIIPSTIQLLYLVFGKMQQKILSRDKVMFLCAKIYSNMIYQPVQILVLTAYYVLQLRFEQFETVFRTQIHLYVQRQLSNTLTMGLGGDCEVNGFKI